MNVKWKNLKKNIVNSNGDRAIAILYNSRLGVPVYNLYQSRDCHKAVPAKPYNFLDEVYVSYQDEKSFFLGNGFSSNDFDDVCFKYACQMVEESLKNNIEHMLDLLS